MTSPASRLYSRLPSARSHSMATPSCNHHTPLSNTVQQEVHKQLGLCTLPKLCTATDGELHLQEPVLVHRLRRLQQTSTCYLLPLEAERKIVCLLLPESEQDIVTKPQLVRWVMTARCALIILAECPGILFRSAAKAACECCPKHCNADPDSGGRSSQTAAPAKIQAHICH